MRQLKPAVNKHILILLAGLLWIAAGVMLLRLAYHWLITDTPPHGLLFAAIGFLAALLIHHFGFLKIVDKNLGRILDQSGKRCIFSFMPIKSYLMIAVMMTMGILLRHSSLPKPWLAILYTAIGSSLILSSIRYLRVLVVQIYRREYFS